MWSRRGKRRGGKRKGDESGTEESIIQIHHRDVGAIDYIPSSSVLPARPLGSTVKVPFIAPVVKKEIEKDEEDGSNLETTDAIKDLAILNASQVFDVNNIEEHSKAASDGSVIKIEFEAEPLEDVSESTLESNNIESLENNQNHITELNLKSADPQESTEYDRSEKKLRQNRLDLWNMAEMFSDASDKSPDNQNSSQPFQKKYIDFCLEFNKSDVEECLWYLNSSFPNVKRDPLFCREVSSENDNIPTVTNCASKETVSGAKYDISNEALKKILEHPNLSHISSDLPDQNNSQTFQSNPPHPEISEYDCSVINDEVIIVKELFPPKKNEPCSQSVDVGKENAGVKSNPILPRFYSINEPDLSKIAPEVSVASNECLKLRKPSENIDLIQTKISFQIPSRKINPSSACSTELEPVVESDISTGAKNRILEFSNSQGISSNIPKVGCSPLKETFYIKKELISPQINEHHSPLIDARKEDASLNVNPVIPSIQSISQPVTFKTDHKVSAALKESCEDMNISEDIELDGPTVVKKEHISPENFDDFGEIFKERKISFESNMANKRMKIDTVPTENLTGVSNLKKFGPASCNLNIVHNSVLPEKVEGMCFGKVNNNATPISAVRAKKIFRNSGSSLSTLKSTQKEDNMNGCYVSSLPVSKDISSLTSKPDSTTSEKHIPVIGRFSDVATEKHVYKELVSGGTGNSAAVKKNLGTSNHMTNTERQSIYNLSRSPPKSNSAQQDNGLDVSPDSSFPIAEDTPSVILQFDNTTSVKRIPFSFRILTPTKDKIPTILQSPPNSLQQTLCYKASSNKRKLTLQDYPENKSYSSSNSNISQCSSPQTSLTNRLDQMSQMGSSFESLNHEPISTKRVLGNQSILSFPTSSKSPSCEEDPTVYNGPPSFSQMFFKSFCPTSGERSYSQEFIGSQRAHRILQSDALNQYAFEPRRGNKSSVMKYLQKIGYRYISTSDVIRFILEWNVSWLEQQRETSIVPPIIGDSFLYPNVKNAYESAESYYNTYLPLHLLNLWMSMYESWEKQDFLPESFFEDREVKHNYVEICCSMRLNKQNKTKLPKKDDILICRVDGHSKKLFGKVVNVNVDILRSSQLGNLGDVLAYIDIICGENFDANPRRPITLQKLNNLRIALRICHALKRTNSSMRLAILNPKVQSSRIETISAEPFTSAKCTKTTVDEIMRSAQTAGHSITLVRTATPLDSLRAIAGVVPEVVRMRGLIFLCVKDEATFFEMAVAMARYKPVLAVREEDVPYLPIELAANAIENVTPQELEQCNVVITLISALSIGELKTSLRECEEGKKAVCLIHEAQSFLETETALLLELDFKKLVLLGREGLADGVADGLKHQSFDKSLFNRILECNT